MRCIEAIVKFIQTFKKIRTHLLHNVIKTLTFAMHDYINIVQ